VAPVLQNVTVVAARNSLSANPCRNPLISQARELFRQRASCDCIQTADPEVAIMLRKSLLVALLAASLGSISLPAAARTEVDVMLNFGPPPLRYEVVPAPRPGYVWAAGYWDVRGHKHIWRAGHWQYARPGHYWQESRWLQRPDGWVLERGRWSRDSDRDGVPDRRDRYPYNPNWR
jgi:hypothetical protein